MTLLRAYVAGLRHGWFVLGYTVCVCLTLLITAPFLMIALRSVGKGWFGRLWFPPQLTWEWYRWAVEVGNIPEVMKNTLIIGLIAGGDYRPLAVEIYKQISIPIPARWSAASAIAMVMGILQVAFLAVYMRIARRAGGNAGGVR